MDLIPDLPAEVGREVIFMKDGSEYRLTRHDESVWVIHKRDTPAERFELTISRDGGLYDIHGRGHLGPLTGLGVSYGEIYTKLF